MFSCCISTPKLRKSDKEREKDFFKNYKRPEPPQYKLSVLPIENESAVKIASRWSYIAQEKFEQTVNPRDKTQFMNVFSVCMNITKQAEEQEEGQEFYVCNDQIGNHQALIVISKNISRLHIDFLVTHPWNIRCKANENEQFKVEGAATLLLKRAEDRARELDCSEIHLKPILSSAVFYLINGYSEYENSMMKTVGKVTDTISPRLSITSLEEKPSPIFNS